MKIKSKFYVIALVGLLASQGFSFEARAGDDIYITFKNNTSQSLRVEYNSEKSECWYNKPDEINLNIPSKNSSSRIHTETKASGGCFFKNGTLGLTFTIGDKEWICRFKEDGAEAMLHVEGNCGLAPYSISLEKISAGPTSGQLNLIVNEK